MHNGAVLTRLGVSYCSPANVAFSFHALSFSMLNESLLEVSLDSLCWTPFLTCCTKCFFTVFLCSSLKYILRMPLFEENHAVMHVSDIELDASDF